MPNAAYKLVFLGGKNTPFITATSVTATTTLRESLVASRRRLWSWIVSMNSKSARIICAGDKRFLCSCLLLSAPVCPCLPLSAPVCSCLLLSAPVCPCLLLSAPVCFCLPLSAPVCPCLLLSAPVCFCLLLSAPVYSCLHLPMAVFSCLPLSTPIGLSAASSQRFYHAPSPEFTLV
jgi:hypothetical protein